MNGWPDCMSDLPETLQPYWCFLDELAILDGLIMKGNRVVVPSALRGETLTRLHDGHQGLTSTLQHARRTVYWPKLQDDISAIIQQCTECHKHGKKEPRIPERQLSATRPMEILGMDLLDFQGRHAVVAVDYFSGYVMLDYIRAETSDAVITTLNNNFRKFGLVESIISDNGGCFSSEKFAKFCNEHEVDCLTSSPYYHESNGRAERAIGTVKQILRKSKTEAEVTMALLAYQDTPVSNDLPSPAELFFNRRINNRLDLMYQPTTLTDTQKTSLAEKRAAHLRPAKSAKDEYTPNQAVWYTEDGCREWKPGFIDCRDPRPDSYWIVNAENNRRFRRNRHDIKPRVPVGQYPLNEQSRSNEATNPIQPLRPAPMEPKSHDNATPGEITRPPDDTMSTPSPEEPAPPSYLPLQSGSQHPR